MVCRIVACLFLLIQTAPASDLRPPFVQDHTLKSLTTPLLQGKPDLSGFPGNPCYLKLPKDVYIKVLLPYCQPDTLMALRQCCKQMYADILNSCPADHVFKDVYNDPAFISKISPEMPLSKAIKRLKELEWFQHQHHNSNLTNLFFFVKDFEWCPSILFDRQCPRLNVRPKDPHLDCRRSEFANRAIQTEAQWQLWSDWYESEGNGEKSFDAKQPPLTWRIEALRKFTLAVHGADPLGTWAWFAFKSAINLSLFAANTYYTVIRAPILPVVCQSAYEFPPALLTPYLGAVNWRFSWTTLYQNMQIFVLWLAVMRDGCILAKDLQLSPFRDKIQILERSSWLREFNKKLTMFRGETKMFFVVISTAALFFWHPTIMTQVVPHRMSIPAAPVSFAEYAEMLQNSTLVKSCCMVIGKYAQLGCYLPQGMSPDMSIPTYATVIANRGIEWLLTTLPVWLWGVYLAFYFILNT